jgi:ATP citrate (pro-S)-lyase
VVKVDQGVKKRGKQGLIKIRIQKSEVRGQIQELKKKGFEYFLVEEFVEHTQSSEKYLAIERTREGLAVHFSEKGGVDIEDDKDSIHTFIIPNKAEDVEKYKTRESIEYIGLTVKFSSEMFQDFIRVMELNYFSFLELNPFLIKDGKIVILDAAVEVDSAAEFFVDGVWSSSDFRSYSKNKKTPEEEHVAELADKSQASFSLTVLNPNGSLFMLLSGGGASIVLADEAYNQGKGELVANYGEYSGNPNLEETYLYTKEILSLLFNSKAKKKVLIVAGGVANFTDVRVTFRGVIQAIAEDAEKLRAEKVKVYVRRGGPNQEEGLKMMADFLKREDLYGEVEGPDKPLTLVVDRALKYIK